MDESKTLKAHLFICTNQRDKKDCCAARGGAELRDATKKLAKKRGLEDIRVNASGCLGHCDEGITAVLYPEGKWFTHLTEDDAEKLVDELQRAATKQHS